MESTNDWKKEGIRMSQKESLFGKLIRIIRQEGVKTAVIKGKNLVKLRVSGDPIRHCFKDVLFINGCYLPHPSRYRVAHQMEQLQAYGLTVDSIMYDHIDEDMIKYYRGFVFFRCPATENTEKFIQKAKYYHKPVIFDIDDLVIDRKYTDTIPYVKNMSVKEKRLYDEGVERMGRTLRQCDCAITTTSALAQELENYVDDVYINRNVASEKMLKYSERAYKTVVHEDNKVILGYFSGSITHNSDFQMILPAIINIMSRHQQVFLKIVGELDIPEELKPYKDRVIAAPFVEWKELPALIASVDVNLAPLEESIFNAAKSENKWMEAALVRVPTVASRVGAFAEIINNKVDGVLCTDVLEWEKELNCLIENSEYRKRVGKMLISDLKGKRLPRIQVEA